MIFSIVRVVGLGAVCSHRRGRTEVNFFACEPAIDNVAFHRAAAEGYAADCQNYHAVKGMVYLVEEFATDDDTSRAPNEMMRREAEGAAA